MHPLSNLIATDQLHVGDRLQVETDRDTLVFSKEETEVLVSAAA